MAGAALPRPVPPPPRLTCVEENTVRQIKSKLIHIMRADTLAKAALGAHPISAASIFRGHCGPSNEQPADNNERNPYGDNRMSSNKNEGQKCGNCRGKGENRQLSEPPSPQVHAEVPSGHWNSTTKFVSSRHDASPHGLFHAIFHRCEHSPTAAIAITSSGQKSCTTPCFYRAISQPRCRGHRRGPSRARQLFRWNGDSCRSRRT